jgi:hypothetical protein
VVVVNGFLPSVNLKQVRQGQPVTKGTCVALMTPDVEVSHLSVMEIVRLRVLEICFRNEIPLRRSLFKKNMCTGRKNGSWGHSVSHWNW